MTPNELLAVIDKGAVEELTLYYHGDKYVMNVRKFPLLIPDYQVLKIWNSEDGKGISALLADNMAHEKGGDGE